MGGAWLGWLAFAVAIGNGGVLWARMQRLELQGRRLAIDVGWVVTLALAAAAFARGPGWVAGAAAAVGASVAAVMLGLRLASAQAKTAPAVKLGGAILDFTAPDEHGAPFRLSTLAGRPFLLKFFRGHWCPYCVAELRRWEELRPELDARGVAIVTLCLDTPEQIRAGRARHGLRAIMLSDADLAVTDRYHLRHPKGVAIRENGVPTLRALPIPTAILVDAGGIVRWIDQSADYQVRSHPDRVREALRSALG